MKRLAWLVLAAFCTALAQVQPVESPVAAAPVPMSCCHEGGSCADHAAKQQCADQSGKPCAVCVSCGLNCHLAILNETMLHEVTFTSVASLPRLVTKGSQRSEPPPLPPPRALA